MLSRAKNESQLQKTLINLCVHLGKMSVEKQGGIKSELSPDGGLKLTIKREKTVEDVCKPEWVTEARGKGLGKLVIKRKSPGSVSQSPKTAGLHNDRHTEQRPILRLSITASASSDGTRQAQVKSWSSCEVSSAVEDVASACELSPSCPLQQSPKDSGVDMSSPPHDDGAVSVDPSSGAGIWSAADCHTGDSSAVEVEKMASDVDKLEMTVPSVVSADNTAHSSSKTLWPDAVSRSCESNQRKAHATLRSRGERSVLKSLTSSSQKLVNPLAKPCRVGRYQHMLPVNRIRAEANVARRSSLEESPTYNMVTSRTNLFSSLPRVKTKLKLLSNNTYAPVFDHDAESSAHRAVDQTSKCLNIQKSGSKVVEHKRDRLSYKSSASAAFENFKVKLCFGNKRHRSSFRDDVTQKLPKLKLVVKSEPALSVSCVEQRLDSVSIKVADKQSDENTSKHVRRKQRQHRVGKMKLHSSSLSADLDHLGANQLLPPDNRSCRSKRTSLESKQLSDWGPSAKKCKQQSSPQPLSAHPPLQSDSQHSLQENVASDENSKSCTAEHLTAVCTEAVVPLVSPPLLDEGESVVQDTSSANLLLLSNGGDINEAGDTAECGTVMTSSSVHTDELSGGQISADDASSKSHTAIQLEVKPESVSIDQTKSSELPAESCSDGTGDVLTGSVEIDSETHHSEGSNLYSADFIASDVMNVNVDDNAGRVDGQHADKLSLTDDSVCIAREEMPATVQRDSSSDCIAACGEALVDELCITSVSTDDTLTDNASSDLSGKSHDTYATASDENSKSCTAAVCAEAVVPSLSPTVLDEGDSVVQDTSSADLLPDSNGGDINKADDNNLLTLTPTVVTEDTLSCITDNSHSGVDVIDSICPVESDSQDTQCQQDSKEEMVDNKELCKKNLKLKSFCSVSDQKSGNECEKMVSDPAYLFDIPSQLMPLSSPVGQDTQCQQDIKQEMVENKELCKKNLKLKSVCSVSDQKPGNECEKMVSDPAYLFDIPSQLMPLSAPCFSKEKKETLIANSACSNGFLAAFTQFVETVSVKKKKSPQCNNSTPEASEDVLLKSYCSQKSVQQKSLPSHRHRSTCSEKKTVRKNRSPHHFAHDQSSNTVECISSKETSLPEAGSSEEVECLKRLSALEDEHVTLCREELVNIVSSHCQLVSLRHRVCELIETVLPDIQFPPGFRRDSASVERFLQDVTDVLSNSEAHVQDIQHCSDPVVVLHCMPDRCLQSLQQQVIRLLSLLLPDTDLSAINSDYLEAFLELMTSVNRPLPGPFCASLPNLPLSQETNLQTLSKLPLQSQQSSLCHADADSKCEQFDMSLSRPESHDTLFNMPSSLLQINSSGPIGDKRSIRRQVKDCLMFLDRDLT